MRSSALAPGSNTLWTRVNRVPAAHGIRRVTRMALSVRPYTVRAGDTLHSIALKRDMDETMLLKLNHNLDVSDLHEGQTIILPAASLSARDKQIINGIGIHGYRTYPVRAGERLEEIISKRGITVSEVDALNPGIDLDALKENQLIKLPDTKYTVREQEVLTSVLRVPPEFFKSAGHIPKLVVGALVVAVGYSIWLWRSKKEDIEDGL